MASAPPAEVVASEDAEFEKAFAEFAADTPPDPADDTEQRQPEGNAPEEGEPAADTAGEQKPTDEDGTSGDEPTPAAAAPAEEAPKDPWATASPELLAARDEIIRRAELAEHKARSDAARVSGLSRKLHDLTNGSAPEKKAELTDEQKARAAKVKQLREDYPEIAELIDAETADAKRELATIRGAVDTVQEERSAAVQREQIEVLAKAHPDYQQVATDPAFGRWLEAQPENVQRLATSWDARETSIALSLFKTERDAAAPKPVAPAAPPAPAKPSATDVRREQQLEGGREVRSRPAPASSGPPDDFEAAFAAEVAKREMKRAAAR